MAFNHFEDAAVRKLIARAKKCGFVTYDELNEALPQDQMTSEQIEDIMSVISEMGVNIVERDTDLVSGVDPRCSGNAVGPRMSWTAERTERLKTMWAEGVATDQIAEELGGISPNGVIGKAHRLGLEARAVSATRTPYEAPAPSNDLILDGVIVRIARVPRPQWFGRWSEKGLASRLYNRLARETATETHIGFLKDNEIKHLNFEADDFHPVPTNSRVQTHALTEDTIFVITEASYWWAELKLDRPIEPSLLRFVETTHELPGGAKFALLTPFYDGQALKFKCPSQPQHPSILPDVTRLLEHEWGDPKTLEPCTKELEPVLSDPLGPTARFRRALNALRVELAAYAILADDDHLSGFSGSQSVADVEPHVDFFVLNSLSPDVDVARFQMDSITDCFDYAVASYDNSSDRNATEVEWNDSYEHHCRIGSPEIELTQESTASHIWYTASTEDRMREAMYTCQRLAPRFGLRVDFDGEVNRAATILLDNDGI